MALLKLEIPNHFLSEFEIDRLGQSLWESHKINWCWIDRPIPKSRIPDEAFFTVNEFTVATNGYAIYFKDCPIIWDFDEPEYWIINPSQQRQAAKTIKKLLKTDFAKMPLHSGSFQQPLESFKSLPNLEVRGNGKFEPAYFMTDKTLVAIIMPTSNKGFSKYIEFN